MTTLTETTTLPVGSLHGSLKRVAEVLQRSAERRVGFFYDQPWKARRPS